MDASPLKLVDLITQQSTRLVVPVYQRPYSWDEENCAQLWDDVLSVARRGAASHFTGSVVWVQEGTMSAGGVTPCLVIDGQQRVTTVTLLIISLARYARSHPEEELPFSLEEILGGGYVVNQWKKGDDHYKLTLSQGDRDVLRALEDNLLNRDAPLPDGTSRLEENLGFFEERLNGLADVGLAWSGLQRLEVVSISLTQGQDNPQLIFESMNSTGKDLASADLIRNYCLMSYPAAEQEELYSTYWRPIEETLGAGSYDRVFDEFVRCWLTVVKAPETPTNRDIYQQFKRYVADNALAGAEEMKGLLLELKRFAGYYARVTQGAEGDEALRRALSDVAALDISVANVLLVSLYDDYEAGAFGMGEFVSMVRAVESYLFRRMVCDVPTNGLNKFFPSLVARLNKVQAEGGDYAQALYAMLMAEAGTARRFPDDGEFSGALRTRNAYGFRRSLLLLSRLENSYHPKDAIDFSGGAYTIEHIMPQAALKSDEWRAFLGDDPEATFEEHVNTLGNLTLTAYNSELSDGSFAEKRERAVGGYDKYYVLISQSLKDTDTWTPTQIEERGAQLAERALGVWPMPEVTAEAVDAYKAERGKKKEKAADVYWSDVLDAGRAPAGTVLYSVSKSAPGMAVVTDGGMIRLEDGREFKSPSAAFQAHVSANGGKECARNGWACWRLGSDNGPLLNTLREGLRSSGKGGVGAKRAEVWADFYVAGEGDAAFAGAFGEVGERALGNTNNWMTFGIGYGFCHLLVRLRMSDGLLLAGVEFSGKKRFDEVVAARERIESELAGVAGEGDVELDDSKLSRGFVWLQRKVDYDADDMSADWAWLRSALLALRSAMRGVYE
jgi:uncharacterized protein with ParB-like and HNH nuclease domain